MNLDWFHPEPTSPLLVTAAVGGSEGPTAALDSDGNFGWVEGDARVISSETPVPVAARYLCLTWDAPLLSIAPAQWPSTAPLLLIDAEDLGKTTLLGLHGVIGMCEGNNATTQPCISAEAGSDWMTTGISGEPLQALVLDAFDPFERFYRQLDSIEGLRPGWDGLDSDPPNAAAIDTCRLVLEVARKEALVPDRLVPGDQSLFLYFWKEERRYANIECDNEGTVLAAVSDRTGAPSVWVVDLQNLPQDLAKLRAYLF